MVFFGVRTFFCNKFNKIPVSILIFRKNFIKILIGLWISNSCVKVNGIIVLSNKFLHHLCHMFKLILACDFLSAYLESSWRNIIKTWCLLRRTRRKAEVRRLLPAFQLIHSQFLVSFNLYFFFAILDVDVHIFETFLHLLVNLHSF